MSNLRQMYANLAARSVSFTTEAGATSSIRVYDLDALPVSLPAANAPARLLLPYSTVTQGRDGSFQTLDTVMSVTWVIADLLLWKPGTLGAGIAESAGDLIRYQGAYMEMLRTFADMGLGNTAIQQVAMLPGLYEWPINSQTLWQAVMVQIVVLEELSS